MLVVLGLCTGLVVHTTIVASGLAVVLAASATALIVLKFIGSAYLAFLAWQAFHAPAANAPAPDARLVEPFHMYVRGIAMNLANPKVILFFLAFLPQFVQPGLGPVALQLSWFGFMFILATLVAFGTIATLAGTIGQKFLRSEGNQRILNRAAAIVLAGLAIHLALFTA